MTDAAAAILERWQSRKDQWSQLHVTVDGAALADEVLRDLVAVAAGAAADSMSLTDASKLGGYSTRQLSRLVKSGRIPNAGTPSAPKIMRPLVPIKPGVVIRSGVSGHQSSTLLSIARDAAASKSTKRGRL